ncbi:hypothetical protein BH10PLA1_BH10PLA1_17790 [soil metagenome]
MSRLIARILLTVFMIPLAALIYTIAFVVSERMYYITSSYSMRRESSNFVIAGLVAWAVLAIYWFLLWTRQVRWTSARIHLTWLSAIGCAAACTAFAKLLNLLIDMDSFCYFAASALCPILWLICTCLIWRETRDERAAKTAGSDHNALVCPVCGYNLTGLSESRCPECGTKFTIDELLAKQPARSLAAMDKEMNG